MKYKSTNIKEIEKILERKEVQQKVIEKMIEKVNNDYEEQKSKIKKNKKQKKE